MKKSAKFFFHLAIVAVLFAVTIFTSALCNTDPEPDLDKDGIPGVSNFQATLSGSRMKTLAAKTSVPVKAASNGKKVLFYTKRNNQWLDYTTDLRQLLVDSGYTVDLHSSPTVFPDLSGYDVLAIIDCLGTPWAPEF